MEPEPLLLVEHIHVWLQLLPLQVSDVQGSPSSQKSKPVPANVLQQAPVGIEAWKISVTLVTGSVSEPSWHMVQQSAPSQPGPFGHGSGSMVGQGIGHMVP